MRLEKAKIRYSRNNSNQEGEKGVNKPRIGAYMQSFTGEYYNINIEKLIPFKNQARKHFDEESLESLALTIKEHGIRQPLTVLPSEEQEGFFEVVSGERRLRAAAKLGLEKIPCIIIHDRKRAEEIAIIENIQRENLHPLELANAYNALLQHGICKSTQEIADKLAVQKSSVVENLNLLSLKENVKEKLLDKKIKSRDFLRQLYKTPYEKQIDLIQDYLREKESKKVERKKTSAKTFKTKNTIISIDLNDGRIVIKKNAIEYLDADQKRKIKKILEDLVNEI